MITLRRRRTDAVDHAVSVERQHSADLNGQLAQAHETIRQLADKADKYRGRNRELIALVLELKAAARAGRGMP